MSKTRTEDLYAVHGSMRRMKEHKAACPRCTHTFYVQPLVKRIFDIILSEVMDGKKMVLPGLGVMEMTEIYARDLPDSMFHPRASMLKTIEFRPSRALIKLLNGLK